MASIKPVMAFLTMKGGVGKTTLAANLTRAMADAEKRKILLIDADAQCNLSQLFYSAEDLDAGNGRTLYDALDGHKMMTPGDLKHQIYKNPNNGSEIDFICGSFETFRLAVSPTALVERQTAQRFQAFIQNAQREYDIVAIDTNPSATLVTMHTLAVSNFLVAPITFDKYSMRGVHLITAVLAIRHPWLRDPLRVRIVPNRIKKPSSDSEQQRLRDAEDKVRKAFPELSRSIVPGYIRQSAIISNEARQYGFLAEQRTPNPDHLSALLGDFEQVAVDLLATHRRAFGDEKNHKVSPITAVKRSFPSIFDDPVVRH